MIFWKRRASYRHHSLTFTDQPGHLQLRHVCIVFHHLHRNSPFPLLPLHPDPPARGLEFQVFHFPAFTDNGSLLPMRTVHVFQRSLPNSTPQQWPSPPCLCPSERLPSGELCGVGHIVEPREIRLSRCPCKQPHSRIYLLFLSGRSTFLGVLRYPEDLNKPNLLPNQTFFPGELSLQQTFWPQTT